MVIDRQIVTRRMLHFAMELQGHRTIDVDTVPDALTVLAGGQKVDLLIVGLGLDQKEHVGLIREVRSREYLNAMPILVLGEKRSEVCRQFKEIEGCAWLDKPFRMNEIHSLVESLLGNAASISGRIPTGSKSA